MAKSNFIKEKPWFSVKPVIAVTLLILLTSISVAQTYSPRSYWTFDNPATPLKDSMGLFNIDPNYYQSAYTINTNAAGVGVRKYITLASTSTYIRGGQLPTDSAFTVEFLFRPGYKFNLTKIIYRLDGAVTIKMGYPYILFSTYNRNTSGIDVYDDFRIELDQVGRKSYGYYTDGNWHHFVFRYNANTGKKEVWIDGQLPTGFSKTTTTGYIPNTTSVNRDILINTANTYEKCYGDLDEIAVYTYSLPINVIYNHYLNFINHLPYSFQYTGSAPPAASPVTASVNLDEFPPGHPNVTVSAIDQLKTFPLPRYKTGHTLWPNFNFMDPMYMGGRFQSGISDATAIANSVTIQTELAKNYNYMLQVTYANDGFNDAWINLANSNPQYKLCLNTYRANIPNNKIQSQALANDHYLQNSSGQFLSESGYVTTNKVWRPTAPITSYVADGQAVKGYINSVLVNRLTRPVNHVNENGEVFPLISNSAMALDPQVTSAKNASGLDWDNFLAKKYMENSTQSFRDQFMNLSLFSGARYSEYRIDGHRLYQFRYEQSRLINTPINGKYYSTTDLYVRWPSNWRNWTGPYHGWQWIVESRYNELAMGDNLFSPFVAAGYDINPESDVRPAQWLGMLKCMNMLGAEFFYTCYFNEQSNYMPPNPPPYDPKGYAWQAVIPPYAQAIGSRYEDYLRNGTLLSGDVPNDYITPAWNAFNFWTGDLRKLVVIRKLNGVEKYAITGTIQPNSNMNGNTELESVATITLNGQSLKFKVRRQGSTYLYDNTNTASPVFYQLDEWHESKHPYIWTKDFNMEAELFDNTNTNAVIKTKVPTGTAAGDFTNATSGVSVSAVSDLIYNFQPRGLTTSNYYLWVRIRSKDGTSTGFTVTLDGASSNQVDCITDTNWVWHRFNRSNVAMIYNNVSLAPHQLKITPSNTKLEIDKISLVTSSNAIYTSVPSPCVTTAYITANGPTTFCQGGNVILTANSGTTYLWSTGATSQSITVSTSGSFTVTVTNGSPAVSSPVTVTVNALPTATITAGGPITFCTGGSVTLTSSIGSAYLWTPGNQTTQAITVSTSGSYTVRVTNSSGCTKISAATVVTVTSTPTATITAGGPTTFCSGGNVALTANSGIAYLWAPGNQTTQSITVTSSGSYTVRVTASGGCSATSSATTVTVNSLPTATITAGGATTFCQGGSVTLTSSTGTSYLWSPGNQTTQSIVVTTSGNYTVRVTGSSGCSATSTVRTVTVNSLPIATITPSGSLNINQGGSVTLTSSVGSSYLWTPGNQTTQSKIVNTAGSYTVRVTNSSGCSATSAAAVVTINSAAYITPSGPTTFCLGGSVTLSANSGTSYVWSSGQTSQSIIVSSSGTYTVTVYSGATPSTSSPVTVTVNSNPVATITAGGSTTFCQGGSVTLTSSAGSSYLWLPGGQTTSSISVTASGSYTVRVTNSSGCSATSSARTVTVNPLPTATITAGGATTFCQGSTVTLTSSSGSAYLWTPGGQTTSAITVSTSGSYSVRVTNSNGCSATSSATVVTVNVCSSCPIPTGLFASNIHANGVDLNWAAVSGVDSLQIQLSTPINSWTYTTGTFKGTYTQISVGAQPNTTYNWKIRSKCGSTFTAWSAISVYTTPLVRISNPEMPVETISTQRVESDYISGFNLYPNPASAKTTISFNSSGSNIAGLKLQDFTGKVIRNFIVETNGGLNLVEVDLMNLPKGVYFVVLNSNENNRALKLILH